jgi:ribosomal protein L40E
MERLGRAEVFILVSCAIALILVGLFAIVVVSLSGLGTAEALMLVSCALVLILGGLFAVVIVSRAGKKKCPRCDGRNKSDAEFCRWCGRSLVD